MASSSELSDGNRKTLIKIMDSSLKTRIAFADETYSQLGRTMRVNDRNTLAPSATETGRSQESQKIERGDNARTGTATGSGAGDRVELSSTLGRLSQAISSYADQRTSRVAALAADYQSGRYVPDAAATSRAMVTEALSGPMH
jgi:anti-sigma28 factor (negative regulator of flagellin synthesis)